MIRERLIRYRGKAITILFSIDRCTHYAACLDGAPEVFDSTKRPWIMPDKASPDKIAEVIVTCPTGALHFERTDGGPSEKAPEANAIKVEAHGPLYFHGDFSMQNENGKLLLKDTRIAFCRCGLSKVKPFCDNTHARVGFEDAGELRPQKLIDSETLPRGKVTVILIKNGPIRLVGPVTIKNEKGEMIFKGSKILLCRCGASKKMPFCDSSHRKIDFQSEVDCAKII